MYNMGQLIELLKIKKWHKLGILDHSLNLELIGEKNKFFCMYKI